MNQQEGFKLICVYTKKKSTLGSWEQKNAGESDNIKIKKEHRALDANMMNSSTK